MANMEMQVPKMTPRFRHADSQKPLTEQNCSNNLKDDPNVTRRQSTPELVSYLAREINIASRSNLMKRKRMAFYRIVAGGNVTVVKEVLRYLQANGQQDDLAWVLGTKTDASQAQEPSTGRKVFNVAVYIFTAILFFLLTPVFYMFHATANSLYWKYRTNPSDSIRLPLVFPVISGKREMIQLFLDFGCHITTEDENNNNIFHYLACLSENNPSNIIKGHEELCACFSDKSVVQHALMNQKNFQMLSGLEAVCKYGSPRYFRYLTENSDCLGTNSLEVGPDKVCLTTDEGLLSFSNSDCFSVDDDLSDFAEAKVDMKVTQFDMGCYEQGGGYNFQSYLAQIFCSHPIEVMQMEDVLAIKHAVVMHKWMKKKTREIVLFSILGNLLCLAITILLLVQLVLHHGDGNRYPYGHQFMDNIVENLKTTSGNSSVSSALDPINDIVKLLNRTYDITIASFANKCHKVSLDTDLPEIKDRISEVIFEGDVPRVEDNDALVIRGIVEFFIFSLLLLDIINRQSFLWYNFNFRAPSKLQTIIPVTQRLFPGSYVEKQLFVLMSFLYSSLLFIELKQKAIQKEFDHAFDNVMSSIDMENLKIDSLLSDIILSGINPLRVIMKGYLDLEAVWGIIFMLCLLLRFISTAYMFRLLPGTGFYVITTKKMCRHLVQFAFFFFLVIAAFAAMFYYVMRDQECPIMRQKPFRTFIASLFTTYTVGLGNDSYDFSGNISGQLVYLVCTIFIIVMLLNLIIAVMTTTATSLNASPWKEAMCEAEIWTEILGTEAQVLTLMSPVRFLKRTLFKQHNQLDKDNKYEVIQLVASDT